MIYLITGYMRSGTSMIMQALIAGGMPVYYNQQRDAFLRKTSDQNYQLNPDSLYEPDPKEIEHPDFPCMHDGKLIKMVSPWLGHLSVHPQGYQICFMRRDSKEISASVQAGWGQVTPPEAIDQHIEGVLKHLHNRKDVKRIREIDYNDVLESPTDTLHNLKIGKRGRVHWDFDIDKAAAVIQPKQKRQDSSFQLIHGGRPFANISADHIEIDEAFRDKDRKTTKRQAEGSGKHTLKTGSEYKIRG